LVGCSASGGIPPNQQTEEEVEKEDEEEFTKMLLFHTLICGFLVAWLSVLVGV
jgi:hypothetical protein